MKKLHIILLLMPIMSFSQKNQLDKNEITFNTDAVLRFWELTDYLKDGNELNDSLWNSYYNLKGNKNYMENNRSEQNTIDHRQFLELFYRPLYADSLRQVIRTEKYKNNDIFQNLFYIRKNEKVLKQYTKVITSSSYIKNSIKLSKKYLPKNKSEKIPNELVIYIQTITYDAAVQDNNMYFGFSVVHDFDKLKKHAIAAHELHHLLRKNKAIANELSSIDSSSYSMVNQINNEGIADLIDKDLIKNNTDELLLGKLFKEIMIDNSENIIIKLDSCFTINALEKKEYVSRKKFRRITKYLSGHLPGYFMADVIRKNGLLQELIDNSDNPFNFFYVYNKAAKMDKENPIMFSDVTINYLKSLELKAYK